MKLLPAFAAIGALCASLVAGAGGPIVNLTYAQYEGVYNSTYGVNIWYGIHYAQPPTGPLRWQPPLDIELNNNYSSMGVMNATTVGPECIQGSAAWQVPNPPYPPPGVEDCLLLDVFAPANPKSASLPVMLQIHGGGYIVESSEGYTPGGPIMQAANGSMIYVTIQYRLGAFGFLGSAEIKENGVANSGLLDQRAAIFWVQRNINAFGGDPSKITIIGGSAGGGSVTDQMILYGGVSNPPFRAVIAEYPWWQPYHNDTVLEDQYRRLLTAASCGNLACLRSLSQEALANATLATYGPSYTAGVYGYGEFYYGPSVDGNIIRDLPSNEFKKGHFTKVPLLVDRDQYEGWSFTNHSLTTVSEETSDLQQLFPYAKPSFFTRLYQLYPSSDYNSTFWDLATLFSDFIICCPTYYMASAASDWGMPVYKMIFDAGSEEHGATSPYLWGTLSPGAYANNNTLGNIMKDYFVSFVTHLDPNAESYTGTSKPYWPKYMEESGQFSVMDVNFTMMGVTADLDASPKCDFFHGQSYVVRN